MIITNSLGSNYTAGDRSLALKLLFQPWKWQNGPGLETLRNVIPAKAGIYPGSSPGQVLNRFRIKRFDRHELTAEWPGMTVELFLKGRHAIYEALRRLEIGQGDEVIVQAFTCVAVVQPILDLGATPVYVDVNSKSLNPSFDQIRKAVTSKTKAIILQHTLGYINRENDKIVDWCRSRKIFIIQDLAHAFGSNAGWLNGNDGYDGKNSSHHPNTLNHFNHSFNSDAIILSFSQDKVIDGISGGALVAPHTVIPAEAGIYKNIYIDSGSEPGMTMWVIIKLLLYPTLTSLIRSTYTFKLGKLIHFCAKSLDLLPSPLDAPSKPARLPNALAAIALNQFKRLDEIITHRRNIALIYDRVINAKFKLITSIDIKNGSCLRYPLWVENRDELENKLTKYGFYLMDHWYDAPVSPEWVNNMEVKYRPGSSPNAENLSKHIFNLPTHINISDKQAEFLANLINDGYK